MNQLVSKAKCLLLLMYCLHLFEEFYDTFSCLLDCFASLKKKKVRGSHNKFMTKDLRKAIIDRSRLRYKFNQTCTSTN